MVDKLRNEPNYKVPSDNQTTRKESNNPYAVTTGKVQANASKRAISPSKANMKEHKVTPQKAGGENLASFVSGEKRPGKAVALETAKVATPAISTMPKLNVDRKVSSAGRKLSVVNSDKNVTAAANKVLGKSS